MNIAAVPASGFHRFGFENSLHDFLKYFSGARSAQKLLEKGECDRRIQQKCSPRIRPVRTQARRSLRFTPFWPRAIFSCVRRKRTRPKRICGALRQRTSLRRTVFVQRVRPTRRSRCPKPKQSANVGFAGPSKCVSQSSALALGAATGLPDLSRSAQRALLTKGVGSDELARMFDPTNTGAG